MGQLTFGKTLNKADYDVKLKKKIVRLLSIQHENMRI